MTSLSKLQIACEIDATGRLVLDRAAFATQLRELPSGKPLQLSIQSATRSQQANAYYWGVVLRAIADDSAAGSMSTLRVHQAMSTLFLEPLGAELVFRTKRQVITILTDQRPSTADLPSDEFYTYVENVRRWAAETLGLVIPDPDPEYWRKDLGLQ